MIDSYFSPAHHLLHPVGIADVSLDHFGVAVEGLDIRPLDGRIVEIVEVIKNGDCVSRLQ